MNSQAGNRGLTLGDVVIILIVIGAVTAVLLPVFTRPYHPHKSMCSSNLKECGIALQTYWGDYGANLPSSALASHSSKWNKRDYLRFATMRGTLPPNGREITWSQLLYSHMKSKDIMFCPYDEESHDAANSRVSYYWKLAIDKAWYGDGCGKPCRNETDFGYNADQVVMYERAGFHSGSPHGLKNGVKFNCVFLDTHVKYCTLVNGQSRLTDDPTAPGEPAYFNFQQNRKKINGRNPPAKEVPTTFIDPRVYSDLLP